MTTSRFLIIVFAALLILSGLAIIWRPKEQLAGRTPLVWVSDNNPARSEQVAAFNREHPDLHLELDFGNANAHKIILQSVSGVGPDIFDYQDEALDTYLETGILWDVTEAAERMGFSAQQNGWPKAASTYTSEGRQYGFPCNTGTEILIYNKNVFDFFRVPYPTERMTWGELVELARKVNTATNPQPGSSLQIFACTGFDWRNFFETMRGEYFTEDGRLNIANSPELKKAFEMHRDFLFRWRLMPTTLESRNLGGQGGWGSAGGAGSANRNLFSAGRFAMAVTGHWALVSFEQAYRHQTDKLKRQGIRIEEIENPLDRPIRIGAIPLPNFEGMPPSYRISSRLAGINANSPRREQALAFLQYLAGATYSKLLNESADYLPGNPEFATLGVEPAPPALSREELQRTTIEAMAHGYALRRSPFMLFSDINRVLGEQISRLESDPDIPIDSLLQTADLQLEKLLRRNLERNEELKELFIQRFGEEAFRQLP